MSMEILRLVAVLLLPAISQAFDFQFNQQQPIGQPLVSSFFGRIGANATFDYVIIGGGTGGLPLAVRLAEAGLSVAVIEAGGFYETDNSNLSVVPAYGTFYTGSDPANFQPLVDWGISTTPQPFAADRRLHYARGKVLGGSSARNYFLYQRATTDSMQKWADEVGDQSWTFDNLLPYYKKPIHFTPPNQTLYVNTSNPVNMSAFEPVGGPVQVSFSNSIDPFGTWCRRAFPMAGMSQIAGFDSGEIIGSSYAAVTIDPKSGFRSSAEASFLQSALNNHTAPIIYKNTLATKIMWDGTKAIGVEALTAGTYGTGSVTFNLTARKEVILAAGALQSPQMLMVNGIGNCSELAEFNIPCKINLPGVGKNLWDHPAFGIAHGVDVFTASASVNNATLAEELVQLYLKTAGGPLSIFGPGYYGFEKLPEPYRGQLSNNTLKELEYFPPDWPELEWLPNGAYNGYNLNKNTADPHDGQNYATMMVAFVAPLSRGTVSLNGPDMTTLPKVDPAWFTAEGDKQMALQAFKRNRQIWEILVKLGVANPVEAFPGPSVQTDAEILQWIGEAMITVYHASATCKMGQKNDTMAVVDSNSLVYGTQNLRIVDASAFPFLPPGHPQSLIYAFAEKIADQIIGGG